MMKTTDKQKLIELSWNLHDAVEHSYLADPAGKGEAEWPEKQRLLLADMAIHLFQTALQPGTVDQVKLKDNLFAILTIADQYFPHTDLKKAACGIDDLDRTNIKN